MKFFFGAALLVTLFATGHSSEEEEGPPPEDNLRGNKNAGEERDAELIAEAMGVDVPAAKEHIKLQRSFKALVSKLEKHGDFSEAVMALNPGDDLEVYFKNKIPDELDQEIEEFKSKEKVNVQKKTTKKSLKEKERVADKITKLLEKKGFSEVGYVINADNVQVMAVVSEDDEDDMKKEKEIDLEKLEKKAKKILGKDLDDDELDGVGLFLASETMDQDHHTRGGRQVYNPNGCTSGFSVINAAGTTGIATAGHCSVSMYDTGQPGENDYPLYFQGQHNGAWGDFEWHTTSHWELPEYWASPTDLRYVTGVDYSFTKNELVCVYSRMKGARRCDRIENTNVSQGGTKRLVAMWNDFTIGGDSGGPWSLGNTAAGFVKGAKKVRTGHAQHFYRDFFGS